MPFQEPGCLPFQGFISEVMDLIGTQPGAAEILVKRVQPLRFAAVGGPEKYAEVFLGLNSMFH